MIVLVQRKGDDYTAQVGPPENRHMWKTDRPYPRDELRRKIEALGVHPIDVADAFAQADGRAERYRKGSSEEDVRLAEQRWPRDVPDQQHVAEIMADNGSTAAEAKMILDLLRGDTNLRKIRRQRFWMHLRELFR